MAGRPRMQTYKASGIAWDQATQDVPDNMFTTGHNVLFRNGNGMQVAGDALGYVGNTVKPLWECYVENQPGGVDYWLIAGVAGVEATDGTSWFDLTPVGWADPGEGLITGGVLNGVFFVNNPATMGYYWDGTPGNPVAALPDWPTDERCHCLVAYKNYLVGLGWYTGSPDEGYLVRWSANADAGGIPQEWIPSTSNDAGWGVIGSPKGDIVTGEVLQDSLIIYKRRSAHRMQHVGGNRVMAIRELFATTGALSVYGVCKWRGQHVLLTGDGDLVMHDGVTMASVINNLAQQYLEITMDPDGAYKSWLIEAAAEQVIALGYCRGGDVYPTEMMTWEPDTGDFGKRSIPKVAYAAFGRDIEPQGSQAWDDQTGIWDTRLTSWDGQRENLYIEDLVFACPEMTATGSLVKTGKEVQFLDDSGNPVDVPVVFEREGLDVGNDYDRLKTVTEVWPRITGVDGETVTVRVGAQDIAGGPITYSAPLAYTIGSTKKVDVNGITGRLITVRFETANATFWRLEGYSIKAAMGGMI